MQKARRPVGVRELRTHLSAYLRAVAQGETVTIGDRRRRPIARLVPIERSREVEHLQRLAEGGQVRLGDRKPGPFHPVRTRKPGPLASDIVIQNRR